MAGEPVRVKCALFYSYIRTNYTMATNAKLRLIWYKNKGDAEEPIIFSGHRLSKEDDSIWFRSAELEDNGFYTCVLRNSTYCMKVSMSMTVEESDEGKCFSSKIRHLEMAEVTHSKMITCPDIEDYLAPYKQPQMTWYKVRHNDRMAWHIYPETASLILVLFLSSVRNVSEWNGGALLLLTPHIFGFPSFVLYVAGMPLSLDCKAFFGYSGENKKPIINWMKGEKYVEELPGHIKESEVLILREHLGEKVVQLSLTFDAVEEADLANYTCYVENNIGRRSGSAILQKKDMYRLELAGGLGVILLLLGILTALYKCYNLEIMLCYRRHFGSDETEDDNKEYDAYLSYTKVELDSLGRTSSDEETFALEILPDVLEKHYGYKLFIPDRDLIPSSSKYPPIYQPPPPFLLHTNTHPLSLYRSLQSPIPRIHQSVRINQNVCRPSSWHTCCQTNVSLSALRCASPSFPGGSTFYRQIAFEMSGKTFLLCLQVMDSGEQGLFGDLQTTVSTIAMTTTSASLAPPNENRHAQMRHFCRSYEFQLPPQPSSMSPPLPPPSTVQFSTLGPGGRHVYCNIPMTLLNGTLGKKPDLHLNSTFVPLTSRELSSDIW
uniref:Interleukin 1 receptor accessory protein-like 2 n=1 Tax=Cyprinodon variegatus TaxID=28743 RepID=A0A3Q2E5Y9_CYPVA